MFVKFSIIIINSSFNEGVSFTIQLRILHPFKWTILYQWSLHYCSAGVIVGVLMLVAVAVSVAVFVTKIRKRSKRNIESGGIFDKLIIAG